jgi:hypothetical protein
VLANSKIIGFSGVVISIALHPTWFSVCKTQLGIHHYGKQLPTTIPPSIQLQWTKKISSRLSKLLNFPFKVVRGIVLNKIWILNQRRLLGRPKLVSQPLKWRESLSFVNDFRLAYILQSRQRNVSDQILLIGP